MVYLKGYMAKVTKHMQDNGKGDKVDSFKANINKVMKDLLGRFKDLDFYCGESMDPDAMVLILDYKEVDTMLCLGALLDKRGDTTVSVDHRLSCADGLYWKNLSTLRGPGSLRRRHAEGRK